MSNLTIYEALRLDPGQCQSQIETQIPNPPTMRYGSHLLFPPEYVKSTSMPGKQISKVPTRKPVSTRLPLEKLHSAISRRLSMAELDSRRWQNILPWPACDAYDSDDSALRDSGDACDDTFYHMLDTFPAAPSAANPSSNPDPPVDRLGELKSWDEQYPHPTELTEISWDTAPEWREVLVSPKNIDEFNKSTNNISTLKRQTTDHNSGALCTFFDDASVTSPTLHANRWSHPALVQLNSKRESKLSKVKVAAKKSAKKVNCFSSVEDEDEDEGVEKGRKASTSTVSTIVSSIAEITSAMSQAKWKLYFMQQEDRKRERLARWTNGVQA